MKTFASYKQNLFFGLTIAVLLITIIMSIYVELVFRSMKADPFKNITPTEIWSHRGYVQRKSNFQQNSLEALRAAYNRGYSGIELDAHFYNGELYINHDPLNVERLEDYLKIHEYFAVYGNKLKYWLELKNLNLFNAVEISKILKELIDEYQLEKHLWVESLNGFALGRLIKLESRCQPIFFMYSYGTSRLRIPFNLGPKAQIVFNDFHTVSFHIRHVNDEFMNTFRNFRKFCFTTVEKEKVKMLENYGVDVVLSTSLDPVQTK